MTPGGAASGQKGSAYERETVRRFRDDGWGALRLPSSGSATERDLPDILAAHYPESVVLQERHGHTIFAVELKANKQNIAYYDADEVAALEAFSRTWGARPALGVRSTQQATPTETFLVAPDAARRTDSGRYAVDVDGVRDVAFAVVGADGVSIND